MCFKSCSTDGRRNFTVTPNLSSIIPRVLTTGPNAEASSDEADLTRWSDELLCKCDANVDPRVRLLLTVDLEGLSPLPLSDAAIRVHIAPTSEHSLLSLREARRRSKERDVDAYSSKYFDLPQGERRSRWDELVAECQGVKRALRRLERLERGLEITDQKFLEPECQADVFGWRILKHFLGAAEERAWVLRDLRLSLGLNPGTTVADAKEFAASSPGAAELEPAIVSDALDYPMRRERAEANRAARKAKDRVESLRRPLVDGDQAAADREAAGLQTLVVVILVGLVVLAVTLPFEETGRKRRRTPIPPTPTYQYIAPSNEDITFQAAVNRLGEQSGAEKVAALRLYLGDDWSDPEMKLRFAKYFHGLSNVKVAFTKKGIVAGSPPPNESEVYLAAACATYRDICCDERMKESSGRHESQLAECIRAYLYDTRYSPNANTSIDLSHARALLGEESVGLRGLLQALQAGYAAAGRYDEWRVTFDARGKLAGNDPNALIELAIERADEPEPVQETAGPTRATRKTDSKEANPAIDEKTPNRDARRRDVLKLLEMAVENGYTDINRLRAIPAFGEFVSLPAFQELADRTTAPPEVAAE
jgi:hypothetical protein